MELSLRLPDIRRVRDVRGILVVEVVLPGVRRLLLLSIEAHGLRVQVKSEGGPRHGDLVREKGLLRRHHERPVRLSRNVVEGRESVNIGHREARDDEAAGLLDNPMHLLLDFLLGGDAGLLHVGALDEERRGVVGAGGVEKVLRRLSSRAVEAEVARISHVPRAGLHDVSDRPGDGVIHLERSHGEARDLYGSSWPDLREGSQGLRAVCLRPVPDLVLLRA